MGWEDALEEDEERTDSGTEPGFAAAQYLLPVAVGGFSLAAGALVGLALGFVLGIAQEPSADAAAHVVTADDITFAKVCAPIQQEAETRIGDLNHQIRSLELDIDERKAKVTELEQTMAKRADAGRKVWKELQQTKEQLAIAMQQKESLEQEKAQLVLALTRTEEKLERTEVALGEQVELTEHYRFESLDHNFDRFVHETQLAICERGNRKRLGNCREAITEKLVDTRFESAFRHCVRAGQEAPLAYELQKGDRMPEFAEYIDDSDKFTRDWYVQLCDPTLPEADTLVADAVMELDGFE